MDENEERALRSAYNVARKRLDGTSGKSAQGAENTFGQAYQALVRAGLAPQLKRKYR